MTQSAEIQQLIHTANYIKHDQQKLFTIVHKYKRIQQIYWIDASNTDTIYSDKQGIALFDKIWSRNSSTINLKQIPSELTLLYASLSYYYNVITKLPADSFESAEYGSNFSFGKASIITDLCMKYGAQLYKYKQNRQRKFFFFDLQSLKMKIFVFFK